MVLAIGSWRIRVPVSGRDGVDQGGRGGGDADLADPVGDSPDSISSTSIFGTDFIRMTG